MGAEVTVNSREWWDDYFHHHWESNQGSAQTRHFMERLLSSLPMEIISYLSMQPRTILDWGCAFGEGVDVLAQALPASVVCGLDFAEPAVNQARLRYPKHAFIHTAQGEIPESVDVIFTSNCLEHFSEPLVILQNLLNHSHDLTIVLVPYKEMPLCEYHATSFDESSFPEKIQWRAQGQNHLFERIFAAPIAVDQRFWPGQQLLVVYAAPNYLKQRPTFTQNMSNAERDKWNAVYQEMPVQPETASMQAFHSEFIHLVHDLLPEGGRILEAGCGGGHQSLALARTHNWEVDLLDASFEALLHARKQFELEKLYPKSSLGDVFNNGAAEYDLVFNAGVLEHYTFSEQADFLRGMASRSRRYVLILVPNRACYWYWLWRIRAYSQENWPFGKEAPLINLERVFEAAGIQLLGQRVLAEAWTEEFITGLHGIEDELKFHLLDIHRTALIPKENKGYLLAALGTVQADVKVVPANWTLPNPATRYDVPEIAASLADFLAVRMVTERQIRDLKQEILDQQSQFSQERKLYNQERLKVEQLWQEEHHLRVATEERFQALRDLIVRHYVPTIGDEATCLKYFSTAPRCDFTEIEAFQEFMKKEREELHTQINHYYSKYRECSDQLLDITSAAGWQYLQKFYQYRNALAPRGSFREALLLKAFLFCKAALRITLKRPYFAIRDAIHRWRNPPQPTPITLEMKAQPIYHLAAQSRGTILFLPTIPWHMTLFQRPQHLARAFAKLGYTVIFDCSGTEEAIESGFTEIEPKLYLYKGPQHILHAFPNKLLWTVTYNYCQKDTYPAETDCVYDWIDDLKVFPHDQTFLEKNHQRAILEAKYVTSVARALDNEAKKVRPDALYLPNGVESSRFLDSTIIPSTDSRLSAMITSGKPIAGYYGALASWFDYDLLTEVAQSRPDWNFVLIGPNYDHSILEHPLLNCPNVLWLGPVAYPILPTYSKHFQVALIPFVINDITLATSPLKLYEYFATGLPVITSAMPECMQYPEVHIYRSAAEFIAALDLALAQSKDQVHQQLLRQLGSANAWEGRARHFLEHTQRYESLNKYNRGTNLHFFRSLVRFFANNMEDPCLPMWFAYASSTTERGREVTQLLKKYTSLEGKQYLDLGCAYGGFLVAFAEAGAHPTGMDINPDLLKLAKDNLRDHQVNAVLMRRNADKAEDFVSVHDSFDLITCNDVIEHVHSPQKTIENIAAMLRQDGHVYMEIPNYKYPPYIIADGHFQLFGITLLGYEDAAAYYAVHAPGVEYTVGHYLDLEHYFQLLRNVGIEPELLDESFLYTSVEQVFDQLTQLEAVIKDKLPLVPEIVRAKVDLALQQYLDAVYATPRRNPNEQKRFVAEYGISFWKILGRKVGLSSTTAESVPAIPKRDDPQSVPQIQVATHSANAA